MTRYGAITIRRARATLDEIDAVNLAGLDERERACAMAEIIGQLKHTTRALLEVVLEGSDGENE